MRQVLDVIETLERLEEADGGEKRIVWRLVKAHTNSPPLTVVAQAYGTDPAVSVALEADRVTNRYSVSMAELLSGSAPDWIDEDIAAPIKRILKRNLNGVGLTEIRVDDQSPISVVPATARVAMLAIERGELEEQAEIADLRRTEYGSIECEVHGLTKWHDRRALVVTERLSGRDVRCVLTDELADELAVERKWAEAWNSGRVRISGALHYDAKGDLKRIDAYGVEPLPWTDVPLSALRDIDVLQGRTVAEHIRRVWGGNDVG
jgi:hypothetical protein